MPAPVHALIVVRSAPAAAEHLARTLEALAAQTRSVDALTIVVRGEMGELREAITESGAEGVIEAAATTSFAAAIELASGRVADGSAVWLLGQDTAPEPTALAELAGALERAPSVALAAPKLVAWDAADEIVSLGVSMTPLGRTIELADGEFDQGQHDTADDVLGADIRGVLVRGDVRGALLPDRALAGADEGLDLGVRARLGGRRVALAPAARVAVAGDGAAGLPAHGVVARGYATRTAQLHRRLSYAPAAAVPLHWLSLLPLALWRTILHLIAKAPARVLAEWGAAVTVMVRPGAVVRSRRGIRSFRTSSWGRLSPLRLRHSRLRRRLDDDATPRGPARGELRFFSGGAAWAVIGALVVSIAAFTALLAWPVLGGGAILPLRETVGRLWADAAYGVRAVGIDLIAPADPFAGVIAVLGTLWPGNPSFSLVLLWVLALPLAVLGGWFAATRVTDRSGVRVTVALLWALTPSLLAALVEGRPAAVLVHLLLPWLFYLASVAHRSWGAAGGASLLLAGVVACAPSLAPALAVLWAGLLVLTIVTRHGRGVARVVWTVIPAVVLFLPLILAQLRRGNVWGIFADPGVPLADDGAGRWALAGGFPTADPGGWGAMLSGWGSDAPVWWVPLLVAPLGLIAVLAPLTPRWHAGIALVVVGVAGLGTAFAASGIAVSSVGATAVAIWPGAGLSLMWLGAIGALAVTLDARIVPRIARPLAATIAVLCVAVLSVPALTAMVRGQSALANGPDSTLPAFVAAEAAGDGDLGTLVLTPQDSGGVDARMVWGASETLGAQSTLQNTTPQASADDRRLAEATTDLVSPTEFDAPEVLAELGVSFVLVSPPVEGESDDARVFRLNAVTEIDQRAGLARVGDTGKGVLWRVETAPEPRSGLDGSEHALGRVISIAQLAALLVALLLAVPTGASRRAARGTPRVVGPHPQEDNR